MRLLYIDNISKYRTEIMGWAILGVMLAHVKTICEFPDTVLNKLLGAFCYSVFTGGFLFLSGFGLYNSMYYDNNIKRFYKKRFLRLLVPYWIISTPYFIYTDLVAGEGISSFTGHITTLSFWVSGNFSGMWYVAVSVLLYAIYPFFFRYIYGYNSRGVGSPIWKSLQILVSLIVIRLLIQEYAFEYFEKISVALSGSALFVVGSLFMSWIVAGNRLFSLRECLELVLLGGAISVLCGYWGTVHIVSIILLSIVFTIINISFVIRLFNWLGRYTLELYIIHLLCFYFLNSIYGVERQGCHIIIGCLVALLICVPINRLIKLVVARL